MEIKTVKRPWIKENNFGKKYNPDPFYQSVGWKRTREAFLNSPAILQLPPINGRIYKNMYCFDCWAIGKITPTHTVDHIQRKRDNGDWTDFRNLQGLCLSHHNAKSAREKNAKYSEK